MEAASSASFGSPLAAQTFAAPSDQLSALDGLQLPRDTLTSEKSQQSSGTYGRGRGSLRYSATKQLLLFVTFLLWVFSPLTLSLICLYRGFCFAEEATGNGNGDGGARIVYSIEASRAIVPVGLIIAFILAPLTAIAAHVQILAISVIAFVLNVTACALLVVAAIGSFAFLATVPQLANERWAQMAAQLQQRTYGGSEAALQLEMTNDVTGTALAALTGAVLTGVVCLMHYPMLHGQVAAFASEKVGTQASPGMRRKRSMLKLCCSVSSTASSHDAAYGQAGAWAAVWTSAKAGMQRLCGPSQPQARQMPNILAPLLAALTACLAPVNAVLSTPMVVVRSRFLTFVAGTCGRPGLAVVAMCCLRNTEGDRDLLARAAASNSSLAQAAAGTARPAPPVATLPLPVPGAAAVVGAPRGTAAPQPSIPSGATTPGFVLQQPPQQQAFPVPTASSASDEAKPVPADVAPVTSTTTTTTTGAVTGVPFSPARPTAVVQQPPTPDIG